MSIGNREFIGEGRTRKDARQDAAAKALKSFEEDPLPPREQPAKEAMDGVNVMKKDINAKEDDVVKSDISLVYETAHNHNLGVAFKVGTKLLLRKNKSKQNKKVTCLFA